jgi:hypothetical protein
MEQFNQRLPFLSPRDRSSNGTSGQATLTSDRCRYHACIIGAACFQVAFPRKSHSLLLCAADSISMIQTRVCLGVQLVRITDRFLSASRCSVLQLRER